MKNLLYILFLTTFGANAQSISNQVISSYGLSAENGTAQTDVTIGELVVSTMSDGNTTLTNGFHQTLLTITTVNETEVANQYQFYPNPVNETLNFSYNNTAYESINLQLFDVNGKLLWSKENITDNEQINFSNNLKGTYLIAVTDNKNNEIKTIRIIKN